MQANSFLFFLIMVICSVVHGQQIAPDKVTYGNNPSSSLLRFIGLFLQYKTNH